MSLVGLAVGYGSFWRFPSLMYKNGGGVFLIPYLISMILIGIPLLYLEMITGQMYQCSQPLAFQKIDKRFKFLGIAFILVCFHCTAYYNILLTYSIRFIFSAFNYTLPFAD